MFATQTGDHTRTPSRASSATSRPTCAAPLRLETVARLLPERVGVEVEPPQRTTKRCSGSCWAAQLIPYW